MAMRISKKKPELGFNNLDNPGGEKEEGPLDESIVKQAYLNKEGLVTNLRLGFEKQKARAQENETSRSLGRSPFKNGVRI